MLGVVLQLDVPAELQLTLDPERMARVLRNPARNAAEAMQGRADAVVTIGARQIDAGVELYVADNGPGISPEVMARTATALATAPAPAAGSPIPPYTNARPWRWRR